MPRILIGLIPLAALAACNNSNQPTAQASQGAAPAPGASMSTPAITATNTAPATNPATAAIPAALQGRWGLVAADCTSDRGDAKGLLVIDSTSLKFYESVGRIDSISAASATRLRASFSFTGEGMNWTRDEVLDAQNQGKTLIRREYGADAAPGPLQYTRC